MTTLQNIKNQINLTSGEKIVASYITSNPDKVILLTVTALAENTNTSLATVLRLIKKLGYKTFGEFKLALTINIVENNTNKHQEPIELIEETIASIKHTKKSINIPEIKASTNIIKNANRVIICGYGVSYSVAYFLYFKLLKLGINAVLANNSYEGIAITTNLYAKDIAILISGSGSSNNILELANIFKKNNNPIIALSNMKVSPLSNLCDHVLVGGIPDNQLNSGAASSRIALIIIAEYLIHLLIEDENLKNNLTSTNHNLSKKEF